MCSHWFQSNGVGLSSWFKSLSRRGEEKQMEYRHDKTPGMKGQDFYWVVTHSGGKEYFLNYGKAYLHWERMFEDDAGADLSKEWEDFFDSELITDEYG